MRYREIIEAIYEGRKQELLQQIKPPDSTTGYEYDDSTRPRLTLRMLHKLRIKSDGEKREREEHLAFLPTMYAAPVEPDKKKKPGKSNDKVEKLAQKTAMQIVKAEDKQEADVGKAALGWIKHEH